jgi:predicted outer membrane repeat protein
MDQSGSAVAISQTRGGITLSLTNVTVSGNSASDSGGGIYSGTLTLTNSMVNGNSGGFGAGIFNHGTLTLINSAVSGNTAPEAVVFPAPLDPLLSTHFTKFHNF